MAITRKQKKYLLCMHVFRAVIFDALINGLMGWLIYKDVKHNLPYTVLCADLLIATPIQLLFKWILTGIFVRRDIKVNNVDKINDKTFENRFKSYYLLNKLEQQPIGLSLNKDKCMKIFTSTIAFQVLGEVLFAIPSVILLIIINAVNNDIVNNLNWVDMMFARGIYSGIMSLFLTPLTAICALFPIEESETDTHQMDFKRVNTIASVRSIQMVVQE